MTIKRNGLGRNLSALLGSSAQILIDEKPQSHSYQLATHCLQPGQYQPRGEMEEDSLNELAASIKKQGILQPLLVRELSSGRYEILAGERRWRAAQIVGLEEVPVLLKQVDDEAAMAIALIENIQREDLNAMEQARAMQRLIGEFTLTHQEIADLLCKSRTAVSNLLRLLSLSPVVQKYLEQASLDMGHARALLSLEEEQQNQAALLIIAKNLSVRETELLVSRIKAGKDLKSKAPQNPPSEPAYQEQLNDLAKQLQTQISLKPGKTGKGSFVIQYQNTSHLQQILAHLCKI